LGQRREGHKLDEGHRAASGEQQLLFWKGQARQLFWTQRGPQSPWVLIPAQQGCWVVQGATLQAWSEPGAPGRRSARVWGPLGGNARRCELLGL